MTTTPQINLQRAFTAHQDGKLDEAEKIYRHLIEHSQGETINYDDVWHLLGALLHQKKNVTEAEQCLSKALEITPNYPEALNTRGLLYKDLGRLKEAETDFKTALSFTPKFPQALTNLAETLRLNGKTDQARALNLQAIELAPDLSIAFNNLGAAERDGNNLSAAIDAFEHALTLEPTFIDAKVNLATTLNIKGLTEDAFKSAQSVTEQAPDYAPALNCLGVIELDRNNHESSLESFKQAIELDPSYGEAHCNFANALTRMNNFTDARKHFDIALSLNSKNADFWANFAAFEQSQNNIDGALKACDKALKLNPSHNDALWNRGIARLISGDFTQGFSDYENRWNLPEFSRRSFNSPQWQGEDLTSKTLLLHSEQGYGDTLQFIRYVALIKEKSPKNILLETHQPLKTLLTSVDGLSKVYARDEASPPYDFHLPLLSLPHIFCTTLQTIPTNIPYLKEKEAVPEHLKTDKKLKIGIVWAGRPTHKNDHNRSIPFDLFKPLTNLPEATFYSLQRGEPAKDLAGNPNIIDLSAQLTDFAATASLIQQLDLVICVDTAVAHLAGAMGLPCWVLLPYAPDWRWLLDRSNSPWYPSLTLFRQTAPGDWASVISRVSNALNDFG